MIEISIISEYFYPRTILDIGAHHGEFHVYARHFFPNSYIFSIEASSACEPILSMVTNQYHIALMMDEEREYDFYTRKNMPGSTGDSVYKEITPYYDEEHIEIQKLTGTTLDKLFSRGFMFDLIKIDTQGSELNIMRGGKLLCQKAMGILLEVAVQSYNDGAPTKQEVLDYMQDINFMPVHILKTEMHPLHETPIQEDILFINKGYQ